MNPTDYTPTQLAIAAVLWALFFALVIGLIREDCERSEQGEKQNSASDGHR